MKTYHDFVTCKKCGGGHITKRFDAHRDKLRRSCIGCGYVWFEPTLDQEKQTSAAARVDSAFRAATGSAARP